MRKLLLITLLLLSATPAMATWNAVVQTKTNNVCSGTTCAVTVTSTGSGHLGIYIILNGTAAQTISSVSGGGTWTHPASCASTVAGVGSADVAYNTSLSAGATTVTATLSGSSGGAVGVFLEYSNTSAAQTFDKCNFRNDNSSASNIAGASLAGLTGTNDVIVQAGFFTGTASGCGTQGGTAGNPSTFPTGDAVCGFINTTTTTANTYTNTTTSAALVAIAVNESSGGGGTATPGHAIIFGSLHFNPIWRRT